MAPDSPAVASNVPSICVIFRRTILEVVDAPGRPSRPFAGTEKANSCVMMKTLLEVGDDFSVRESVKNAFGQAGYEAVLAAGGLDEVGRLLAREIDVVLLDINVPSQSSWKTWQRLACGPFQAPGNFATGPGRRKNSTTAICAEWILENPNHGQPLPQRIQLLLARSNDLGAGHSQGISYPTTA
jgi:DNA-binding response OmpR family regulator